MKLAMILGLFSILAAADSYAAQVCVNQPLTKRQQRKGYVHQICAEVDQTIGQPNSYSVTKLQEIHGANISSQKDILTSKNKVCRELLAQAGVVGRGYYVKKSVTFYSKALHTSSILPTISSMSCVAI